MLAAFGLLFAWVTLMDAAVTNLSLHADKGQHVTFSAASAVRLAGSTSLFLAGMTLALSAALRGVRLK
jgi:hypothetical protein